MEMLDLEIFIAVSEEMSMNKASQRMFLAQSAVSTRVHNLERELGCTLFTRSRAGVQLTPFGGQFLQYAVGSIDAIRQGEKTALAFPDEQAFVLGTTRSLAVKYVPRVLQVSQNFDTSVMVETITASSEEILSLTRSGAIDLGLVYHLEKPGGVESIPIQQEDVILVGEVPSGASFRDFLMSKPFVMLKRGDYVEQYLDMLLDLLEIDNQRIIARVDNLEVLIELVRQGIGNSIIPKSYLVTEPAAMDMDGYIKQHQVYATNAPAHLPGRTVYIVFRENKCTPLVKEIVKQLLFRI